MRRKIAKVIEVKSFAGVDDGITVMVEILHLGNVECIGLY